MNEVIATDTLIVGAGLAGLRLADILTSAGHDFQLVEARDRIGGRVLTHTVDTAGYDLGPAWCWDGQPRIAALIRRFDLAVFEQFALGDFRYEDAQGRIQQGRGAGSMKGSFRLAGGMQRLCHSLALGLPENRLHLNTPVLSIARTETGTTALTASGQSFSARRVVFALPPRLVAHLKFEPVLSTTTLERLENIPTWMAGQAKAIALFETAFWRDEGLSGDAMSHRGPMVEIHDASPATSGPFALFGFIGVPPENRMDEVALKAAVHAQLQRLFGPNAREPLDILLKDWAQDNATATPADAQPLHAHPTYGMPEELHSLWEGRLGFAGSEVAPEFGGFLEGALEAAEAAALTIISL